MYIFIFMVHLFFCSCSFVWSLGFRNIYSVEKMYIFTFCFSIFFLLLLFSFLGLLCIFKVSVIVCWIVQIKCLVFAQKAKDFETFFGFFSLFSCFCFFSSSSVVFVCFCFNFVSWCFFLSIVSLCLWIMFCWSINICIVQFWNILCSVSNFWSLKIFYRPPKYS